MRKRILFMENDVDFIDVHASVFENAGYQVEKAYSLEEAKALLAERYFHLAIFDIRMLDDDDPKDISGLLLAQAKEYGRLPKLILTGYPQNYDHVRQALSVNADGTQPAVNFLGKSEGVKVFIEAVGRAFEQHVRVNWDLVITSGERAPVGFVQLVGAMFPNDASDLLAERADELEGLFRALFFREDAIRIERVLWRRGGRVAVAVFPFAGERQLDSVVVVCGPNEQVAEESARYREFAPKGHAGTTLVNAHETLHFGANVYALADTDIDHLDALGALWRSGPDKSFNAALQTLFEMTLAEWSKERRIPDERRSLEQVFRERLRLTRECGAGAEHLRERVGLIGRWAHALGCSVEPEGAGLTFAFGGQTYTYADPTLYAERQTRTGRPVLLTYTPGTLTGENVLADANGHTWLTDFADAGLAPPLWNFVSLEAAVRFDWAEPCRLVWLHAMEECLLGDEFLRLNAGDVEPPLKRPLRTIQTIRRLASKLVGKDALAYHLGILFNALRRIADINPALPHKTSDFTRYTHLLMSAAMTAEHLKEAGAKASEEGVRVDEDNRAVWVDGSRVDLRGRSYQLMLGFYENAGRVCTRRQIAEQFLRERYDETDVTQVNRLNTAISRLRFRVEDDPENPRFIITEPGGYRLSIRGKG